MTGKQGIASSRRRVQRGMKVEQLEGSTASTSKLSADNASPFQLQEYLATLVANQPHDIDSIVSLPRIERSPSSIDIKGKGRALENAGETPPEEAEGNTDTSLVSSNDDGSVDQNVWIYELLRRLCLDLTSPWLTSLETVCNRQSCSEMKGGEWLYLCAAHASTNETECCAIDYIEHTLDAASALLNSSRYFPSRLSMSPTSFKHFTSISRRLYRVFSHAYYHHNDLFQACEMETSLYARFKKTAQMYNLVGEDILVIPASYEASHTDQAELGRAPINGNGGNIPDSSEKNRTRSPTSISILTRPFDLPHEGDVGQPSTLGTIDGLPEGPSGTGVDQDAMERR